MRTVLLDRIRGADGNLLLHLLQRLALCLGDALL